MTWYIAITNPNCQKRAENELAAHGYRAFWPKLKRWVSHARVKTAKEYPVLGRYMFVEVPDGNFWTIRNVGGIEALLTTETGKPMPVPEQIVWHFRERYMSGEWDWTINETGLFESDEFEEFVDDFGEVKLRRKLTTRVNRIPAGAIIRIMEGEFANMLGVVRGAANGKLKILPRGAQKFAHIHSDNVRAA